jgi:hypothetical protein
MKRLVVFAVALFALCASATLGARPDQGCYVLVNGTPGFVTVTFNYLNGRDAQNRGVTVRLRPGDTYRVCFQAGAGAQAVVNAGAMWDNLSDPVLPMGGYPSAVPEGTYSIVLTTRYPVE